MALDVDWYFLRGDFFKRNHAKLVSTASKPSSSSNKTVAVQIPRSHRKIAICSKMFDKPYATEWLRCKVRVVGFFMGPQNGALQDTKTEAGCSAI